MSSRSRSSFLRVALLNSRPRVAASALATRPDGRAAKVIDSRAVPSVAGSTRSTEV
jgi:hypothetical protein